MAELPLFMSLFELNLRLIHNIRYMDSFKLVFPIYRYKNYRRELGC